MLDEPIPLSPEAIKLMFYTHTISQPAADACLWRYMDFTKFVSMLDNQGLFFTRSTLLGDPFEGSFSKQNLALRPVLPDEYPVVGNLAEALRASVLVTCWHANQGESAAMWKLYSKTNESVAIQARFSSLKACLKDTKAVLGEVHYVDYSKDWIPEGHILYPFFHKRKSFEHEREVRAVMLDDLADADPDLWGAEHRNAGQWVTCDLNLLVENIYVSPTAPGWFRELVAKVSAKYGLNARVHQSTLDESPVY